MKASILGAKMPVSGFNMTNTTAVCSNHVINVQGHVVIVPQWRSIDLLRRCYERKGVYVNVPPLASLSLFVSLLVHMWSCVLSVCLWFTQFIYLCVFMCCGSVSLTHGRLAAYQCVPEASEG